MTHYNLQDLSIDRMKTRDYLAMSHVYQKSIAANSSGFIQDISFHGDIGDIAHDFIDQGGDMLVARVDSKLVGFGGLRAINRRKVELCKLHVDADYQGLGIGRKLTEALINRAKIIGFVDVELHVTATQTAAIKLYESLGFRKTKQEVYEIQIKSRTESFDTLFMLLPMNLSSSTFNLN